MALFFGTQNFFVMQKSLDALWLRQKTTANNIANVDTPGFKTQKVQFENYLQRFSKRADANETIPDARISVDNNTSLLENGNNVDIDKENLTMLQTQLQYETMTAKISDEFSKLKYVINEGRG